MKYEKGWGEYEIRIYVVRMAKSYTILTREVVADIQGNTYFRSSPTKHIIQYTEPSNHDAHLQSCEYKHRYLRCLPIHMVQSNNFD